MYEIHPDSKGQWLLYQTGDGGFDLIGTFADQADAELAHLAFDAASPTVEDGVRPDYVTAELV